MILADSVGTLSVELRTKVKRLRSKEKVRRKRCRVRASLIKKKKAFLKSYMKVGVKKLLFMGLESVEGACSGNWYHRKGNIYEADGSSSRQKGVD